MKFYQSPRWTAEIADCSMPITFDQYSNCAFKCLYCFSTFQKGIGKRKLDYFANKAYLVNPEKIQKTFTVPDSTAFWPLIKDRVVMQWGGLADPFCNFERDNGLGLQLLRFFRSIDYPICFSTKGTWWLDDPRYTELFKGNKNWNVKISIITLDEEKAKRIEVGVPTPNERLEALGKVTKLECGGATLRLRPFILGVSSPRHCDLIRYAADRGATALSTEFFCLEDRSATLKKRLKVMSKLAGFDLLAYYRKYSTTSGYLRLNRNVKRPYIDAMEATCKDVGMRFYVSDAHFKERCANGSCCGLGDNWNYSRAQFCEALLKCKKNGTVTWSEIEKGLEYAKGFGVQSVINLGNRERESQFHHWTAYDFLKWCWNNPNKSGKSPYKYFEGIMKPSSLDENGNVIYSYDKSRE